ncbi:hypothetical protein WOLCODRAFT_130714 [Wolfiporia cocos MD-104 SS10]|uniref:N-acetyltransferase ECO1 n=1 Tax=Wolfiporia cocos (strain MD-104) TaxID=742152 RepID=A0A2H3JQ49_WOLCO|nr:hypothetical protein WOLCODRAFT_130714 [Wolfiporia cocos MD-104 SS10]
MASTSKRTYGLRAPKQTIPSSPVSEPTFSPPSLKRKRPLDSTSAHNSPPAKKPHRSLLRSAKSTKVSSTKAQKEKDKAKLKQPKLTQLHFTLDTTVLRTCPLCDLSYTRGAPDDESLHKTHCARVQRGLDWGREEQREMLKAGVEELESGVKLKNGAKGRIVCFRPDVGGKIGAKLNTLLETISLALSSPPLSQAVLQRSKIYLFLLTTPPTTKSKSASSSQREKIVGCVIAQRISTAMAIASDADNPEPSPSSSLPSSSTPSPSSSSLIVSERKQALARTRTLIPVDTSTNLYVHPNPLPTPMGIPRLFVSSTHRRLSIASRLLSAAAQTFILGCPLDPAKGEVAFTQPTGAGKAILEKWGRGGVRIYEEEQGRC